MKTDQIRRRVGAAVSAAGLSLAVGMVLTALAPSSPVQAQFEKQILKDRFAEVDKDKDGIITYKEMQKNRKMVFGRIDVNRDGKIIEGEFMQYQSDRFHKRLSHPQFDARRRQYYRLDRDHNKEVTPGEFEVAGAVQFRILDANRNGEVTWEEFSRSPFPSTNRSRR